MNHDPFYQNKGGTPAKVESWSHFNDPIPKDGQPHGNSRRHGDASPEVQAQVIDTIVAECHKRGFTREDTAHVLAIARVESGFNPDAAAGESSASGVGQFIAKTGAGYGINASNRFNLQDNVKALVDHFEDNKKLAFANGKDSAWVYKYHHDGPVNNSGGLSLAKNDVLPHARAYLESDLLKDFKSSGPAKLGTGARVDSEFKHRAHSDSDVVRQANKRHDTHLPKIDFDLKSFVADFQSQIEKTVSPAVVEQLREAKAHLQAAGTDKTHPTAGHVPATRAEASTISLGLAIKEHLLEKGFDANTVAKAEALAESVKGMGSKEAAQSLLVIHKEGADVASQVPKAEPIHGLNPGDSVLDAAKLKAIAGPGLDVDAVANLRGLAPEKTEPRSDLEVYQSAPTELYQKAVHTSTPLSSLKDTQDLVKGLGALDKLQSPQPEQKAAAAVKESQHAASASAGMSAGM